VIVDFAHHVAQGFNAHLVVEVDSTAALSGAQQESSYATIRVAPGADCDLVRTVRQTGVPPEQCVVAVANIELRSAQTATLLDQIRRLTSDGASAIISTSDTNADTFRELLRRYAIVPTEFGLSVSSSSDKQERKPVALVDNFMPEYVGDPPPDFDVLAVITAFNEDDVLGHTVSHLVNQGIRVHVIDNWSTDSTQHVLRHWTATGMVTTERFPPAEPSHSTSWKALLERVTAVAAASDATWVIHNDADEIRRSPWLGVSLRDAIFRVERAGFSAIDFTVIEFWPTDNRSVTDLERDLRYFAFGLRPGHFVQVKAWANWMGPADLASSGGHSAAFPGRRVFPYKFLLKHYPIRSQMHGEKKVFKERQGRWDSTEVERGWHHHYDHYQPGESFLRDPRDLEEFNCEEFYYRYLIERLTGLGLPRPSLND
jgi:hypothetical protein